MISAGLPIYIALQRVDLRLGYDRLGGWVREHMAMDPRSRALFVFVGKRGHTMKILTWDGSGVVLLSKRLDCGRFELPVATEHEQQHVIVSDALFGAIYQGAPGASNRRSRRTH